MRREAREKEARTGIFWGAIGIGISTVVLTFGMAAFHTYIQHEDDNSSPAVVKTSVAQEID